MLQSSGFISFTVYSLCPISCQWLRGRSKGGMFLTLQPQNHKIKALQEPHFLLKGTLNIRIFYADRTCVFANIRHHYETCVHLLSWGNSFLKFAIKFPFLRYQCMGQHTENVPNLHLQLLQNVLAAHADITAVSTHISPTTIICRLLKKSLPLYNSVLTIPISRSHSHYNGNKWI